MTNNDKRKHSGQFGVGNKAAAKSPIYKSMRAATKDEVMKCAHSLIRPWGTIQEELRDENASRLSYLVAHAVSNRNYKFIQWMVEMAIGRPKQVMEVEGDSGEEVSKLVIDMSALKEEPKDVK